VLTGSSVATAVVSSIAAIVWDSRPDLTPREVMNLLYKIDNAPWNVLGFKSDFGASSILAFLDPSPRAHRISLCDALYEACHGRPNCPIQDSCLEWKPEPKPELLAKSIQGGPKLESCQPWLYPQPEDDPKPTLDPPRY
jgi:hypothetical protein